MDTDELLAAKERKDYKEKPFCLCAPCALLRPLAPTLKTQFNHGWTRMDTDKLLAAKERNDLKEKPFCLCALCSFAAIRTQFNHGWTPMDTDKLLAAKERKDLKEKPFHLCAPCVLLRPLISTSRRPESVFIRVNPWFVPFLRYLLWDFEEFCRKSVIRPAQFLFYTVEGELWS